MGNTHAISQGTAARLVRDTRMSSDAYKDIVFYDSQETVITITAQDEQQDEKLNALVAQFGTVTLVKCGSKSPHFMCYYNYIVNGACSCSRDRERDSYRTGIPALDRNVGKRCKHVLLVDNIHII